MNTTKPLRLSLERKFPGTTVDYCQATNNLAGYKETPEGHAVRLPKAMMYQEGPSQLILTPNGKILSDLSFVDGVEEPINPEPEHLHLPGTAAVFTSLWSGAFYHWFYNTLPRMKIMRDSGLLEDVDWYIVDPHFIPALQEAADRLGLPTDKFLYLPRTNPVLICPDHLIVSSFVRWPNQWSCNYIVDVLGGLIGPTKFPPNIFLGRKTARLRNLVNFDSVFAPLQQLGFMAVELEDLCYADQISLFASAKIIVAVHGAGLSHLPFCQPGTIIIELFSPKYVQTMYEDIARLRNLKYRQVIGTHVATPGRKKLHEFDLAVDPNEVIRKLSAAYRQNE